MTKICIELYNGKKMFFNLCDGIVPKSVENFLRYVDEGFYTDTVFHRIITGFMSQGGGYVLNDRQIVEKPAHEPIEGEFKENGFYNPLNHACGVISMARTNDLNSASNQFFICSTNATFLNEHYAAFGYIADEESMNVAEELNHLSTMHVGEWFTDFPCSNPADYTVKAVYRV